MANSVDPDQMLHFASSDLGLHCSGCWKSAKVQFIYTTVNVLKFHTPKWLANSADPDQTAPKGAVWSGSTLFAIPLIILRNNWKSKKLAKKVWNKVFEILGH